MLRDAEMALKQAKAKSHYKLFDEAVGMAAEQRLGLEADLRDAVDTGGLVTFYQPIVSLETRRLAGFEALVRWQRGSELIPPGAFIPLAEKSGLIVPLGSWLMRSVFAQVGDWNQYSENIVDMVSFNLSGKDFTETADIVGRLSLALSDARLHPAQIRVEVTEGALIENVKSTVANLHAIRELGVKIELDDFGTGYSSLSYLHEFPIDTIKIDRSFVMRMPESSSVRLVKTIVRLAGDLGIEVIAEGVETEEQLERLADMGCTLGQGYLFSRPLAARDAMALLDQTNLPTQKAP